MKSKDSRVIRWDYISYTLKHKIAYLRVERELLGHITIRGLLHDIEKPILYLFLKPKTVQRIHKSRSKHHLENVKTLRDYECMLIDWECCRDTKSDKPLSAREYARKIEKEDELDFYLKGLGL